MAAQNYARELKTLKAMIRMHCTRMHSSVAGSGKLCQECELLVHYATKRLEHCPHGDNKPTCAKCPVHCYKPDMREKVRHIMRTEGPRMLLRHPILTLYHFYDSWKVPAS